jgi:hypothetical protein
MPTCNLAEIVHNILLQQLGKHDTCLYIATFDDYIRAFKQSTLYKQYLQGSPSSHGLDRNELLGLRIQRLSDPTRLATIVANYTSKSSFTNCLPHLKGEEVFGSSKWPTNCPPSVDNDSHYLDRVNFSSPRIITFAIEPNVMDNVHMQQPPFSSSKLLPLVSWSGLELKEGICVDVAHPILQFNVLH